MTQPPLCPIVRQELAIPVVVSVKMIDGQGYREAEMPKRLVSFSHLFRKDVSEVD